MSVGLGTGGLPKKTTSSIIRDAMRLGYRLFDMAREYNNEEKVARIISGGQRDGGIPLRDEVFIVSKVWPTNLGFHPTTIEVFESLRALNTPFVDLYLLHWPS